MAGKDSVSYERPGDTDDILRSDVPYTAPREHGVRCGLRTPEETGPTRLGDSFWATERSEVPAVRAPSQHPGHLTGHLSAEGAPGHMRQPSPLKQGGGA